MSYKFTASIVKEGKWYVARAIELGVVSQGRTIEETKRNLKEAVELYLEHDPKAKKQISRAAPAMRDARRCGRAAPLLTTLEARP